MSDQKRSYRKRLRAEQEEETRRRIVESAVALHGSLGPSRTTLSAIAEHAGVQRSTLYRHFADEASVFGACSELWANRNPLPDLAAWAAIADPDERLGVALGELYAFYARNEQMLANLYRDAALMPAVAERFSGFGAYLDAARGDADAAARRCAARRASGRARRSAHALAFSTWRSLVGEQRLRREVAAAADVTARRRRGALAEQRRVEPGDAEQARAGVRADHRADLREEHGLGAEDLAARARPGARRPRAAWMCWTTQPSAPSSCAHAQVVDHALERAPLGAHALDRRDRVLDREDRLDLQRAAEPAPAPRRSARRGAGTRACRPRTRSSSARPRVVGARDDLLDARRRRAPRPPPASTMRPCPPQALRESTTSTRRCPPRAAISAAAWRADSHVPEIPPARWTETMSLPASTQRLVDLEEVADRRLRGRRQLAARAQPLVERVEVRPCRTRARACRRR